ncbi:phage terminase small subunit P27 family [Nocardia takedensis]|uniref:phage terminase small subunit P27 family n=1 Tax=Nocardia takedensis TaxID=259390 RepID=UPI003F776A85
MPAPTPQPAALRLLGGRSEGRDSGGRKVAPPPAFARIPPNPPTWLSREARAEWRRVVPGLTRLDLLKEEDRAALSAYCETWATYVEAIRVVRREGFTVTNHSVRKDGSETTWITKNPAVAVADNANQQLRAWCHEFGLTPSAESRVTPGEIGDDPGDDPFA